MGNNSSDVRVISEDFLKALKDGVLSTLTEMVKNNSNLIMCFRDGYINVYYKGHSVFKITEQKKNFKVEFNWGHARYTDENRRNSFKKELEENAVIVIEDKDKNKYTAVFYLPKNGNDKEKFDCNSIERIATIYINLIDDFFEEGSVRDYFKVENGEPQSKVSKKDLTEKRHQQRLFSEYFCTNKEYLFLDMEYAIPRKNKKEPNYGSPDCIALKMDNGMPVAIMLVEVKSTKAACTGKSGIKAHIDKYNNMINKYRDKIRESTKKAIEYYKYLDLLDIPTEAIEKISTLNLEKLFVFTSEEVKTYYDNLKGCEKLFEKYDK